MPTQLSMRSTVAGTIDAAEESPRPWGRNPEGITVQIELRGAVK